MTDTVVASCGHCSGPIIAATVHHGKLLTPARCAQCGASPVHPYGPVIPMGPVPVSPVAKIMAEVSRR
jgi:hypothetical protein